MLSWLFRKTRGPVELAADMVGVRLGERLIYVGPILPRVFAMLAKRSGLTGRACALAFDPSEGRAFEAAAAGEGVFAEVFVAAGGWPLESEGFDVGVVDGRLLLSPDTADAVLSELRRCLRPGARAVAILERPRGIAVRLGFEGRHAASDLARMLETGLGGAGFTPVRLLAEREGLTFVEGFRAR